MKNLKPIQELHNLIFDRIDENHVPERVFLDETTFNACATALGHGTNIISFDFATFVGVVEVFKAAPGAPSHSVAAHFSGRVI